MIVGESAFHEDLAEPSVRARVDEVAGQREVGAGSGRHAFDQRDDGLRESVQRPNRPPEDAVHHVEGVRGGRRSVGLDQTGGGRGGRRFDLDSDGA